MNAEIYQVSADDLEGMTNEVMIVARLSSHIIMGRYNNELICYIGFVPQSVISDTAYVWMHTTEAARKYPLILGRHARRGIHRILSIYPRIIGHCFTSESAKWLVSLGATLLDNDMFEIRRA